MRKSSDAGQWSRSRWMELINSVTDHRDQLVDAFMAQVDDGRRFYDSKVETADLRESSRAAFTMLLRQLRGTPTSEEDLRITRELGVRRASQGVEIGRAHV